MGCIFSKLPEEYWPMRPGQEWVDDIVTGSVQLRDAFEAYLENFKNKDSEERNFLELIEPYCMLARAYDALQNYYYNCTNEINIYLFNVEAYRLALASFPEMDRYMTSIRFSDDGENHKRIGEIVEIHVKAGIVAKNLPKNAFLSFM